MTDENEKPKEGETPTLLSHGKQKGKQPGCCGFLPCYCRRRYVMVALCCAGMIIIHAMRVNVGITLVSILEKHANRNATGSSPVADLEHPRVSWTPSMIGMLHSIFYVGFLITQIPGGYLSTKIPATRTFSISIVVSCTLNLFVPTAIAHVGYWLTCIVRLLQGLSEGITIPAMYRIIHQWAPKPEKNRLAAICLAGMYAGAIIGFPLDGAIVKYLHWYFVYYIHGMFGIVWFMVWTSCVYEKPEMDIWISDEEKDLIQDGHDVEVPGERIPWKAIFTSIPFWAIMICNFARSWMFFFLLTNEPAYLNMFKFTIVENGIFSAAPHVFKVLTSLTGGFLADIALKQWKVSTTILRKVFTCFGFTLEAAALYCLAVVTNGYIAVAVLCIGIGLSGFTVAGWQVNHMDLAPKYVSVLVGISSTFGTVGGILSPMITGFLTHEQTLGNWQKSFILSGSVMLGASICYLIFGSGEKQPWAYSVIRQVSRRVSASPEKPDASEALKLTEKKTYNSTDDSHK